MLKKTMFRMISRLLLLISFTVLFAPFAQAQTPYWHPELKWFTFDTPHFVVHYHQGTQRTAFLAAKIIEDIYPGVTKLYDFEPKERVHLILKDVDDYSNGGAYFFNNKIEIWASNLDFVMRGTKNWLRDVLTHEFTHIVSIQKTIKTNMSFPYGFVQFFGYENERRKDVVRGFPNVLVNYPLSSINMPVWFAEGVAQFQNTPNRYDYRDPHREMILRDRVLHNQMLTYNAMSVFGKTSLGNESSYNQGFAFVKYLADQYGEKILSKITAIDSKWSSYTFTGAIEKAIHQPIDTLYNRWKNYLQKKYVQETRVIRAHAQKGIAIEKRGFANLYPALSADGSKLAYVSNKEHDYFSQNALIVMDRKSGKKKEVAQGITSSISWSPDGRYIAFARKRSNKYHSLFNDLYLYDLQDGEEIRLTENLRGSNPDFSPDGSQLVFVSSTDGLNQLNIYTLPQKPSGAEWQSCGFDAENGIYHAQFADDGSQREVRYLAGMMRQLHVFADGRQVYHPRWSNDGQYIVFDTAIEYGRNIGRVNVKDGHFDFLLKAREELRYPSFQRGTDWLYYAASNTGIYNIYRFNLKSGVRELLTNVSGGAFMPTVDQNGALVYSLYDSLGYKIYSIEKPQKIDPSLAVYDPDYLKNIPKKTFNDDVVPHYEVKPYKPAFTNTLILPRLLVDYGTVKPGFYVAKSDVLDKLNFVAGAAMNTDFDYDLYAYANYTNFMPEIFLEAYNSNANINDTLSINRGYIARGQRNVNFNLLQFSAGLNFRLSEKTDISLAWVFSRYSAKLDPVTIKSPVESFYIPTIRYDYLHGQSIQLKYRMDHLGEDRFADINPSAGYFLFLKYAHESNDFLQGFSTNRQLGLEDFKNYSYNSIELSGEYYLKNPLLPSHAFGFKVNGGYIDRPVDSFFNFFAGGLIGLRGYPFYSIEGRQKLIMQMSYRFPLSQNLDWRFGHVSFDKLYFGTFFELGDAFNSSNPVIKNFKQDVGVELRLDSFSYNMFPTRLFFQAAWPLQEVVNRGVTYPRTWRYYFGILFDFDLRERMDSALGSHFTL